MKKLYNWWRWEGRYYPKQFIHGVKNIWEWLPIVWKDREWDSYYIWDVLKFKIKKQAEYLGEHDYHESSKRDSEIMMTCTRLIDKIQNDYYSEECFDYYENDFSFIPVEGKPNESEIKIEQKSEHFDDYFKKYPRIYKQVINSEKTLFTKDTKFGIAVNIGLINQNKAKKILFNLMERNISNWWN